MLKYWTYTSDVDNGYHWWLLPYGHPEKMAWIAQGFAGQRLVVFPDENLIVASTAWHALNNEASLEFDIVRRLLPGVQPHQCGAAPKP